MPKVLAITGGTVFVDERTVVDGDVLMRYGKVVSVGPDVRIPKGAEVIDARGKIVTAGLIDCHTHLGNCGEGTGPVGFDHNEAAEAVTPHVRAIDGIDPRDAGFADARRAGITSVCVLPGSANVIGGTAVVLKTAGTIVDEMVVRADVGMKIAFGENPKVTHGEKRAPQTRMGTAALLRETLSKARDYQRRRGRRSEARAGFDFRLESLLPVLSGKMPLRAHAHRADDMVTALRVAGEFGCKIVLDHCTEGHLIAEFLARRGFPCVVGPALIGRFKVELKERSYATPGVLERVGCRVALMTDHPFMPIDTLTTAAAFAVREGMSAAGAFRAITSGAAEILGLGRRLGRLAPGFDADAVVWTTHPLESSAKVVCTVINGRVVYPS